MSVTWLGDYDTTETVNIPLNTFDSNDPTASVTVTNLAAGDVEIHKDGSDAQRTSDAGVTVSIDFDTVTGNHLIAIDLSNNTDVGFYAAGSRYLVRIEGATVDGGTINAWVAAFSIGCTLRPTTAGRKLDVTATGAAGIDWANVENKTAVNDLTQTDIQLVDTCTANSDLVSAAAVVNEWESQSQADPTGFHVNVMEWLSAAAATPTVAGVPEVDLTHVMGAILTEGGAGRLAAAIVKLFDVAAPTLVASDVMRGTDSANTTVPDAAGVAPTAVENRQEMDSNSTELAKIGTIPALDGGAQTIGAAIAKLADDNAGADYDAGTDSLQEIRDRGDAEWITATSTTVSDKTGFSLSSAGIDAIWDNASALTLDFGTIVERIYQLLNNEMNITDATGAVALRNLADNADMATGSITDNAVTTSRAAYSWV